MAAQIDETVGTHVTDPNAFAVIVEGDSMELEIRAGDRVVVAPNLEVYWIRVKAGSSLKLKMEGGGRPGGWWQK